MCFRTVPGHPNTIAPGKRPMHTIIPGMAMKGGRTTLSFGVMGGHYQAVGHAQIVSEIVDRGATSSRRRMRRAAMPSTASSSSSAPSRRMSRGPRRRGHKIEWLPRPMGGCQIIEIDWQRGVLIGGSDPRKDGMALGY